MADEERATFKQETVTKILQQNFADEKTKLSGDAAKLAVEVLRVFVTEGATRAAIRAQEMFCCCEFEDGDMAVILAAWMLRSDDSLWCRWSSSQDNSKRIATPNSGLSLRCNVYCTNIQF
ncbi:hypothetical protein CAPTEDRAFT_221130 [Capitella teleta]|uniref:Centromere protein X n=1 Tax=Capitella teleta TaxID=283909 RepID=R7U9B3_CAPTE|nr:hypothetical protein CAPTEDRAFT_221130 [Capitella teleta]|eukprot:ELU00398.1 hypothetical protein CAPTEDRAFT_221130 [Capitella teleta]